MREGVGGLHSGGGSQSCFFADLQSSISLDAIFPTLITTIRIGAQTCQKPFTT